jgi:hypothetical protein
MHPSGLYPALALNALGAKSYICTLAVTWANAATFIELYNFYRKEICSREETESFRKLGISILKDTAGRDFQQYIGGKYIAIYCEKLFIGPATNKSIYWSY